MTIEQSLLISQYLTKRTFKYRISLFKVGCVEMVGGGRVYRRAVRVGSKGRGAGYVEGMGGDTERRGKEIRPVQSVQSR
jgi:hypothetical protein